MTAHIKTRRIRRPPPNIGRAGAVVFSALAKKTKYAEPALSDHWPDIAGAKIAGLCRPGRITGRPPGRTLEIHAPSGAAAAQLQMQTDALKTAVNRYLGPNAIARIVVIQSASSAPPRPAQGEETGELGAALSSFRKAIGRRNNEK